MINMVKKTLLSSVFLLSAVMLQAGTSNAQSITKDDFKSEEFNQAVREYLLENPEVIEEALANLQKKAEKLDEERKKQVLIDRKDEIFNKKGDHYLGNPEGSIVLVEFFDYNCGFCKKAMADKKRLVENNKDLKIVIKDFPILREESLEAAEVGMVFHENPEKYQQFHEKLLSSEGNADYDSAKKIAMELGATDIPAKEALREDKKLNEIFSSNYELARAMDIRGTPFYIIGDTFYSGAPRNGDIQRMIDEMRKCGKTNCEKSSD